MTQRDRKIQYLLWKEVADKTPSACVGFILAAIFCFFHSFGLTRFDLVVKVSSLIAISANILRLTAARKLVSIPEMSKRHLIYLKVSIWINSSAWAVIFYFASHELNFNGFNFILILTLIIGFASASLVTLGYDKSIYLPFQILTLIPTFVLSLYKSYSGEMPDAKYFSLLLIIFFIYQIKQFRIYRAQILERLGYQVDLEHSLVEVKESKEAFMEQTAKLVHASQITALGDMAGGLAHEVNNSLQVILGSTQQVQRELEKSSDLSENIKSKFRQNLEAIQKIKTVIDGLKYFSLQMEPEQKDDFRLKEIIDRTLNYTFELIKAHQISLNIEEVPDIKIHCHPFQITQILFNLIKNADDALAGMTEHRWIDVHFQIKDSFLYIKIKNGGRLITPEVQNKLFRPFFSTKDINQGSGLSLSISRGIALDHKGDLYFDNSAEFTTFILKLPVSHLSANQ